MTRVSARPRKIALSEDDLRIRVSAKELRRKKNRDTVATEFEIPGGESIGNLGPGNYYHR